MAVKTRETLIDVWIFPRMCQLTNVIHLCELNKIDALYRISTTYVGSFIYKHLGFIDLW